MLKVIHTPYANFFSLRYNKDYKFNPETYQTDTQVNMLCKSHAAKCYECKKNHVITNNVNVMVCEICELPWSFGLVVSKKRKQSCCDTIKEKTDNILFVLNVQNKQKSVQ